MTQTFPDEAVALPGDGRMPLLGFGTWQLRGAEAVDAVGQALEAGYRHIDTATIYGNESEVGAAVSKSGVDRGEVFLTTKIPPRGAGNEQRFLRDSLEKLGTEYLDLWLIHWPSGEGADVEMWRALLRVLEARQTRAIGVSNYSLKQIDELARATGVMPDVNQIEWSPLLFDRALLEGHRERGVVLEGYSAFRNGTLEHPVIRAIADRHRVSPAQVIVRWHLQHGVVVIPKSANPDRIRANAEIGRFELSDQDMSRLDGLSRS